MAAGMWMFLPGRRATGQGGTRGPMPHQTPRHMNRARIDFADACPVHMRRAYVCSIAGPALWPAGSRACAGAQGVSAAVPGAGYHVP